MKRSRVPVYAFSINKHLPTRTSIIMVVVVPVFSLCDAFFYISKNLIKWWSPIIYNCYFQMERLYCFIITLYEVVQILYNVY